MALRDSILADAPTRRGVRPSMTEYAAAHCVCVEDRPTFADLFIAFTQQLAEGYALDTEALIDVLTLKTATAPSSRDPIIALEKLYHDTVSLCHLYKIPLTS